MKKKLTAEQTAKRDARRAKFKELWKQVAAMERVSLSHKYGFRKAKDSSEFSPCNSMLIALQCPTASVLAGFRDWLKLGRCVRKGEHGVMVWVPIYSRKDGSNHPAENCRELESHEGMERHFITGTVFDIASTDELTAPVAVVSPEVAAAFGMADVVNETPQLELV